MRKTDFLSVVVPAYNEASRIGPTLVRIAEHLGSTFGAYEIIVVDDGSTDDTPAVVRQLGCELAGVRLIRYGKNRGKGYAVRTGCLSSKGNLLLISDADLSTPIEEIEKLLAHIDSGSDMAIGSRGLRESDIIVRQSWHRERMGRAFNLLVRLLAIGNITDTQCGFKLMKGTVARDLFSRCLIDGFSFDVEMLFLAKKAGCKISETPVRWLNSPNSRVRLLRDPVNMFMELIMIRVNSFMGRYEPAPRICRYGALRNPVAVRVTGNKSNRKGGSL
jgi:dolichyl-phosphate beta-glucosyltransferase